MVLKRLKAVIALSTLMAMSADAGFADIPAPDYSPQQLQRLAVEALKGSAAAADRLVHYYGDGRRGRREGRRHSFWVRIAFENGSASAFVAVGGDKLLSRHPCDRMRGISLLREGVAKYERRPDQTAGFRKFLRELTATADRVERELGDTTNLDCAAANWEPHKY
jgi:hypothetical protein